MSDETLIMSRTGEWTVFPMTVCKVTGTVYHEVCVMGEGRSEYPCCGITYVVENIDA